MMVLNTSLDFLATGSLSTTPGDLELVLLLLSIFSDLNELTLDFFRLISSLVPYNTIIHNTQSQPNHDQKKPIAFQFIVNIHVQCLKQDQETIVNRNLTKRD